MSHLVSGSERVQGCGSCHPVLSPWAPYLPLWWGHRTQSWESSSALYCVLLKSVFFLEQARLLPPSCSFEGCHLVICPACTEISPWMSMRDINVHDGIRYAQDEPPFFQHGKTTMWLSCLVEIMWSYCAYKNQTITERWQATLTNLTTRKWSFHNNWWTPF